MRFKKGTKQFVKKLLRLIVDETTCAIQYNNCPCNTCFHTWAEDDLGLNNDFSHLFWMVILALRGDYTEEEILKANNENLKEIISNGDINEK